MMTRSILVSNKAIKQWKRLCKRYRECKNKDLVKYLIIRAVKLGQVVYLYEDRSYIVRYHDLELIVSSGDSVLFINRSLERDKSVEVNDNIKCEYDKLHNREIYGELSW